jgi:ABC-type lipoprotein release transport system permease subunit
VRGEVWRDKMKMFLKGVITGAAGVLVLVVVVLVFRFFHERDRKIIEYMEAQHEIEALQEDIGNRPLDEFLEDPGVRGAADNADAQFRRKRNEAVQRIRGGYSD